MLKRIREILAVALLDLVFGAGMAVVLCVGALAVLVTRWERPPQFWPLRRPVWGWWCGF